MRALPVFEDLIRCWAINYNADSSHRSIMYKTFILRCALMAHCAYTRTARADFVQPIIQIFANRRNKQWLVLKRTGCAKYAERCILFFFFFFSPADRNFNDADPRQYDLCASHLARDFEIARRNLFAKVDRAIVRDSDVLFLPPLGFYDCSFLISRNKINIARRQRGWDSEDKYRRTTRRWVIILAFVFGNISEGITSL